MPNLGLDCNFYLSDTGNQVLMMKERGLIINSNNIRICDDPV